MNQPAIDYYLDNGVDLAKEMLEISLCAQHNNGGLDIDDHWETRVKGLFAAGEIAGSHGVYRPGGSALNAGQVGSARAALYIAKRRDTVTVDSKIFATLSENALREMGALADAALCEQSNIRSYKDKVSGLMSTYAGAIRNREKLTDALAEIEQIAADYANLVRISSKFELPWVYRVRDMLIASRCYISAMMDYAGIGGKSRGSALYSDPAGVKPYEQLPDEFTFAVDDGQLDDDFQTVEYDNGTCSVSWRKRRPIPKNDDFFEVTWKSFRETGNVD